MKSTPITNESGFSQLDTWSPEAFPVGTRPDAIAPTTVPMKNGVRTDANPKIASDHARPPARRALWWNAKPEPRSTMPSAARLSGMNNVEKIASNAVANPVQSTTRMKISQTWLASQTGPIAQSISSRGRRPPSPRPASRLQKPAPKSAPPKMAYIVAPIQRTIATASALLIAALLPERPAPEAPDRTARRPLPRRSHASAGTSLAG